MLTEKWEQVWEKGGKFSKKFVELLDGRENQTSDLGLKEKILRDSDRNLERRDKEFVCRKW
jgi:hypothetical protein